MIEKSAHARMIDMHTGHGAGVHVHRWYNRAPGTNRQKGDVIIRQTYAVCVS